MQTYFSLIVPYLSVAVFQRSERETEAWVGTGFDTDLDLLRVVRSGQVSETPVGKYLTTLRNRFAPEVIVDMMCLLRLRAKLAIPAKAVLMMREAVLMMREAGFDAPPDPTLEDTLEELRYLERSIGKTGLRAHVHPFLDTSMRDLWQLHMLSEL